VGDDLHALRELERVPLGLPPGLELVWLGVAGYRLTYEGVTILVDPYVSRVPLRSLLLRRPALPDDALIERHIRAPGPVSGVLIGHTHWDHAVDAPALARRYGCPAYGSDSLARLLRLHGVSGAVAVEPRRPYELGPFVVRFVPSRHSKLILGRKVPFDGPLTCEDVHGLAPHADPGGAGDGIRLDVGGEESMSLLCNTVINSAGFNAQAVARTIRGIPESSIPPTYYAIGHYYTLSGAAPFNRLIYPVARQDWLGVHVTIDLGGQVKFGPDFAWIDRIDYRFDDSPQHEAAFYTAIRRYYPGLKDGALQPGYTGIRPKIHGPGEPAPDFLIQGPRDHGVPGLVNLYGIESPGLTSSLAIGDHVSELLA
jgi:hypothetical protein